MTKQEISKMTQCKSCKQLEIKRILKIMHGRCAKCYRIEKTNYKRISNLTIGDIHE